MADAARILEEMRERSRDPRCPRALALLITEWARVLDGELAAMNAELVRQQELWSVQSRVIRLVGFAIPEDVRAVVLAKARVDADDGLGPIETEPLLGRSRDGGEGLRSLELEPEPPSLLARVGYWLGLRADPRCGCERWERGRGWVRCELPAGHWKKP